jgi:hypothetical protein
MSLKEDTVSADRKERIIFDPEAWRKSDKSGKKTSAITSRQNFDNEKFTRKADQEKVDEGTIQPSGDSKVDSASPSQSDTISKDKPKKSNNPQIEFVTGTAQPNGSSSTATGNAQASATGRKIAEALVKKALSQVNNEEVELEEGLQQKLRKFVPGYAKKQIDRKMDDQKFGRTDVDKDANFYRYKKIQDKLKKEEAQISETCKDEKKKKPVKKEETNMSEKLTYAQFMEQLLEYTPGPGGRTVVKGRSYGANYDAGEDDDKPAKPAADAPKRGRGRPAGSKSGANQKVTTGKSYGGIATHSLNLPNSNR